MRTSSFLSGALLLLGGAITGSHAQGECLDKSAVVHTGTPAGKEIKYANLTFYVAEPDPRNPRTKARAGAAVLYLSDVFGLGIVENKLLADSFARAGYLTIVPDLFDGSPAPGDISVPGFNTTEFLARHNPTTIDPKIASSIRYLRRNRRISRIGAPGYCFGGRYTFRFAGPSGVASVQNGRDAYIDATYAAHPSLLSAEEILAIGAPASIAAAATDPLFDDDARVAAEKTLKQSTQPYRVTVYSGTDHGFAVRANLADPEQKEGKEEAFLQAVAWFDRWLLA
ncbi:hypothetical protein VTJ83DRAFT_2688 [Remersonia thermophila]|uniref:Dienelactone hydrolase domain-containing protein n=1 Tax=Remersonia thermophila TaxID=72144 RepID=A0ABR4DJK3_9PEZI